MSREISINGESVSVDAPPGTPLLWVLRDELKLTGTKFGCGIAACGACTVHVDGVPTRSCQTFIEDIAGAEITTIEGLTGPVAAAVKAAWSELDVVQCGYCQSGQIMSAVGLLASEPRPDDAAITSAMAGNVCRCATYQRIRAAIRRASDSMGA
jgi:isoquinoline 1-oxidoreductase subunit alpha